jgi:hypothetical protein
MAPPLGAPAVAAALLTAPVAACPDGGGFLRIGRATGHARASGYVTTTGFDGIDHDRPPSCSYK